MEQRDGETEAQFATRLGNWLEIVIMHGDQAENQIGYQVSSVVQLMTPVLKGSKYYVEFKEYPVIFHRWYFPILKLEVQNDLSLPYRCNSRREGVLLLLQRWTRLIELLIPTLCIIRTLFWIPIFDSIT